MYMDNYNLLWKMNKTQYYEFLRYAIGMKYYLLNEGYEVRSKLEDVDEKGKLVGVRKKGSNKERILAYLYKNGIKLDTFSVMENDYDNKSFHNGRGEKVSAESFFYIIDDYLMWSIMMGVLGEEFFSAETYDQSIYVGRRLFEEKRPTQYRFILGAGVNANYGLGDWAGLMDSIRDRIRSLKSIPAKANPDELVSFEETMSNTNYIAPQILKDLDTKAYYDVIYKKLYGLFDPQCTNVYHNPSIEDTTLFQVARIVAEKEDSMVLTFNYDDVLERVLSFNFGRFCWPDYYRSKKKNGGIQIIHSHGYYPYGMPGEKNAHALVFSCFEYMNGYLRPGRYARKRLYEQIKQPCILIGNSLSDYEEQKVFFLHHEKHLSQFSYLFTKKSDSTWMDIYKSVYFLKMGVIPVFFDDYTQMINYLKRL